jgi:hypothetical protein
VDDSHHLPSHLNFTALGSVSAGFTVGAIRAAVCATLTPSRLRAALGEGGSALVPLREEEFLGALAAFPAVDAMQMDRLRDFQDAVLGYNQARTPPVDPAAAGGGKKK